jgi:hypothetical protein
MTWTVLPVMTPLLMAACADGPSAPDAFERSGEIRCSASRGKASLRGVGDLGVEVKPPGAPPSSPQTLH